MQTSELVIKKTEMPTLIKQTVGNQQVQQPGKAMLVAQLNVKNVSTQIFLKKKLIIWF